LSSKGSYNDCAERRQATMPRWPGTGKAHQEKPDDFTTMA
jgi:hypothetical protein